MSLLLQLDGHTVACAHDGLEALQSAREFDPQVVLLDLGLPRMNGYDVARQLREHEKAGRGDRPRMLLIAISGYGRDQDRQAAQEAGFDYHLTKPADPDMVMRMMQDHGPRDGA
jgi:CheY-like chemotaxis protein